MAITIPVANDNAINGFINVIAAAERGRNARSALAGAVERCYTLAVRKAGGIAQNGVTESMVNEHVDRISTAVFGEEVRDALRTGLLLCYSARGVSPVPQSETAYLKQLIDAQTGEDLKNAIMLTIATCCQDVNV